MRTAAMSLSPLVLALLLALGCVNAMQAAPTGPEESFILRAGDTVTETRISGHELAGPDVQLSYTPEGIRGRAFGRLVDLQWSSKRVEGFYGGDRVDLTITPEPGSNGVVVRGLYGSNLGEIAIRPTGVEGTIGICTYQLKATAPGSGSFEGRRSCRSLPEQAAMEVPQSLYRRSSGEVVALLAVLLGR
jgi:hypothetical protein